MTPGGRLDPADWDRIGLVVFDIDGTLYDQRRLRIRMMRDLLLDAAARRRLDAIIVLRAHRQIRERLAEREAPDFEAILVAETASATGHSPDAIRRIVEEWIERRPLPYLPACRYPGLVELFAGLRRDRKIIGILSDYPAGAKLAALGLDADHIVCANDDRIGLLKPNPRGLLAIIAAAGVSPAETVLIGDRADRDGLAARRSGVWPLIRSGNPIKDYQTFARFDDAIFKRFLAS
jgi:putative hydrolase of the HAD superfamily